MITAWALVWPVMVMAHEPVFSLGPHTLYKGGIGIELEAELLSKSRLLKNGREMDDPQDRKATRIIFPTEIIYGLTTNLALTTRIPVVYRTFEKNAASGKDQDRSAGLGDILFRSKYRFWRRDTLGVQQAAAVVLGVKLPTGNDEADLPLGTGSTDYIFGLTAGHEGRRLYVFGDLRYRLNTEANGVRAGNIFFYDAALGFRPRLTDYYRPDLVLLLEFNGEAGQKDELNGGVDPDSGGRTLWLGPNFLLSYRNHMLKGGIRFPFLQRLNGIQLGQDYEAALAMEIHY